MPTHYDDSSDSDGDEPAPTRVVEEADVTYAGGFPDDYSDVFGAPAAALLTRTVNGTGHTGPSEFCATSI